MRVDLNPSAAEQLQRCVDYYTETLRTVGGTKKERELRLCSELRELAGNVIKGLAAKSSVDLSEVLLMLPHESHDDLFKILRAVVDEIEKRSKE